MFKDLKKTNHHSQCSNKNVMNTTIFSAQKTTINFGNDLRATETNIFVKRYGYFPMQVSNKMEMVSLMSSVSVTEKSHSV